MADLRPEEGRITLVLSGEEGQGPVVDKVFAERRVALNDKNGNR